MNDLRYFRNDKLDLVNREKQRFGFRKLSSGKIASVLLGVTIFGSFALNGQVVKADTTTDGSQTSAAVVKANNDRQTNAVVDEPKSTQNNKGQGATANKEEQSGQDTSAQNYGSHSSSTITSEGGEETTEAKTGNIQADSTGTDTKNANRGDTTSDKKGAGADNVIPTRALVLVQMPKADQPTAQKQPTAAQLVDIYKGKVSRDKYGAGTELDLKHAQSLLDYYNNLETVKKILNVKASSYGESWLEQVIGKQGSTLSNEVVDKVITSVSQGMVTDTQAKIDAQIENLEQLAKAHPNNQEIQKAISNLRDAKNSVTVDNITNANAMKNAIGTLDKYGSKKAYEDIKKAAENPQAEVNKGDLKTEINTAKALADDPNYYNSTNKDAFDKALSDAETVYGNENATQKQVDDAKKALDDAKNALDGEATKKKDLQTAYDTDTAGKATDPTYYNASEENKQKYDDAVKAAKDVLDNENATQKQVDDAKKALDDAKNALDGEATDKDALQSAVNDASTTKLNDKYYNANQDKRQAYDQALDQATKVLNNKNASQKAVDEAVANLEKAKAELNGGPNFIGGDYTPSEPSTPSTETPAEKTTEKILMHAAYLYDNKGIKIDKPTVKSYVTVVVAENPVTINGAKYYKVAGKDEYIKVDNIDGTLRVITHNSYIYNNKGKATRSKGIKRLVKKTRIVKTYGAPINIKGHMMYRIAKNRYIKARNFEGTLRRLSHNSFVYDENGKATRNKGIRRLLKKSRVVRTFDVPVKINGHMMYRVDNGYVKVKNFK